MNNLVKSIMAGIILGFVGFFYLNILNINNIIAAFLFSIGLIAICLFNYKLFTGLCGDINKNNFIFLLCVLIGNLIGTFSVGAISAPSPAIQDNVYTIIKNVNNMDMSDVLLRSIGCGVLMYIAVSGYKYTNTNKNLCIILCIPTFILSGCLHSIALSYYYAVAIFGNIIEVSILKLVVVICGNVIGSKLLAISSNSK